MDLRAAIPSQRLKKGDFRARSGTTSYDPATPTPGDPRTWHAPSDLDAPHVAATPPKKGPAGKTDFPADQICSSGGVDSRVSRRGGKHLAPGCAVWTGQVRIDRVVPTVRSGRTEQIKLILLGTDPCRRGKSLSPAALEENKYPNSGLHPSADPRGIRPCPQSGGPYPTCEGRSAWAFCFGSSHGVGDWGHGPGPRRGCCPASSRD